MAEKKKNIKRADARVDAYIANAEPFAQPILEHVRLLIWHVCPECEETMKWSFPHFDYQGQMMCSMAAFKQHVALTFWKAKLFDDTKGILTKDGMGSLGKIRSVKDLPSDTNLTKFLKKAMKLNEEGTTVSKPKAAPIVLTVPDDLTTALKTNVAAKKTFENFSPSNKREYVDWIREAKSEDTRQKRLTTAIEWMAEGKIRNWKYVKK